MSHLVPVGNSLGLRIPKAIIAQAGFNVNTDLAFKVTEEGLLITPVRNCREGWEKAFNKTRQGRKEKLLLEDIPNEFDETEWQW
ncbi:MAG: AbrB/MazE/SpoVT family DNA-binding domain-containing protein [Parachlamydia sp.]|nr:AbrB/MazE/SpoVT family DNA-binding domain-containing protein [Parachlamydia sp.]